ncbi:secreted protein [Melampsora americana]|nr:secreted protein [Melampsora americana]
MLSFKSSRTLMIIFIVICITQIDLGFCRGGVGQNAKSVQCQLKYQLSTPGKNLCMGPDSRNWYCKQCKAKDGHPYVRMKGCVDRGGPAFEDTCVEYYINTDTQDHYTCVNSVHQNSSCPYTRNTVPYVIIRKEIKTLHAERQQNTHFQTR